MSAAEPGRIDLEVAPPEAGNRLDRFLVRHIPDRSRSFLARLIRQGLVSVDGAVTKAGQGLKAGQQVRVEMPPPAPLDLVPEAIPLEIIFEDEHLAVVDKPAGLVAHPAAGHRSGTLVNALLFHLNRLSDLGPPLRPGIVHRLDKDTSGLLIVAKQEGSHRRLSEMLAERRIQREYLALVWGRLAAAAGVVEAPIGRDRAHRKKMAVVEAGGRPAVTRYLRVDSFGSFDYIRLELGTGRTHQIRVHMAHLGHPLVGDPVYGGRSSRLRGKSKAELRLGRELLAIMSRQALHAYRLRFVHPVTGRRLAFESPLPRDMQSALALLRGHAQAQGEAE